MNLFDRLLGRAAAPVGRNVEVIPPLRVPEVAVDEKSAVPLLGGFSSGGSLSSSAGLMVNQASAMQVSAVHACVKIISADIAKLRPVLKRRVSKGRNEEVDNHPVTTLLRRPNNQQSWFDFCRQQTAAILLRGNAYAPVIRDRRGQPTSWVPVNPDRVTVLEATGGTIFYQVAPMGFWEMDALRSFDYAVPQEDCLHVKDLGASTLIGLSTIALARDGIALAMAQEIMAASVAGNGARPSGVLAMAGKLDEKTAARLKADWQNLHGGPGSAGKTAILENGLEFKPISLSMVDAEFLAQRRFQIEDIARIFRVPMHMLNVLERATFANIEEQHQSYLSDTLSTYIEMWTQTLDRFFGLYEQDLFVEFDTTTLLRNNVQARFNAYRTAIMSGFLTINEARAREGLPPVDGGDEPIRPMNMVPIDTTIDPTKPGGTGGRVGSDQSGAPAPGGDGDPNAQ